MFIFTFSVPGAAPSNVRGQFTSSTSISVKWDEVPDDKRHGEILYYIVIWRVTGVDSKERKRVDAPLRQSNLNDLVKYTNYSIQVLAATLIGEGPPSIAIVRRTDEDSK